MCIFLTLSVRKQDCLGYSSNCGLIVSECAVLQSDT